MGKQVSAITMKGKVGNVVGYSYLDKNLQKAQGLRIHQPDVKNPQTDAQARQRARLLPLTSFYRQCGALIKRGYQEVGYGQPSRRIFMRDNMKDFQGPWLPKGTTAAIPGPFIIARGSLVPIAISSVSDNLATTDLGVGNATDFDTIGDLSSALMANNTDIQIGDQLTFITGALINGAVASVVYRWLSIVISPDDATPIPESFGQAVQNSNLQFAIGLRSDEKAVAAGVIQSRDGGSSHLRSFSQMAINESALTGYYGNAAVERAIESYQTQLGSNDWPVEQFAQGNASTPFVVNGITLVGLVVRNGIAYGIDANGGENLLKNHDARTASYGKFLGASGWVTIDDPTGSILEVFADSTQEITPFFEWLVRNFGYSITSIIN